MGASGLVRRLLGLGLMGWGLAAALAFGRVEAQALHPHEVWGRLAVRDPLGLMGLGLLVLVLGGGVEAVARTNEPRRRLEAVIAVALLGAALWL